MERRAANLTWVLGLKKFYLPQAQPRKLNSAYSPDGLVWFFFLCLFVLFSLFV